MEEHLPRKLAVIFHADVVGSTLLVQQNETLAHERIQNTFQLFSETIKFYEGIAHELRGDALVAEFERASDAVAAALAGARSVVAVDRDRNALRAVAANASANGVSLGTALAIPDEWQLLLASDVLYEPGTRDIVLTGCRRGRRAG